MSNKRKRTVADIREAEKKQKIRVKDKYERISKLLSDKGVDLYVDMATSNYDKNNPKDPLTSKLNPYLKQLLKKGSKVISNQEKGIYLEMVAGEAVTNRGKLFRQYKKFTKSSPNLNPEIALKKTMAHIQEFTSKSMTFKEKTYIEGVNKRLLNIVTGKVKLQDIGVTRREMTSIRQQAYRKAVSKERDLWRAMQVEKALLKSLYAYIFGKSPLVSGEENELIDEDDLI